MPGRGGSGGMLSLLLGWVLLPGCQAVSGPPVVVGRPGGSVSVECSYGVGFEMAPKFWCKPGLLFTCYGQRYLVTTAPLQPQGRRARFAIMDDRSRRSFRVTVGNLSREDAGTYLCGMTLWWRDLSHTVEVVVAAGLPNATEPRPSPPPRPGAGPGRPRSRRPVEATLGSPLLLCFLLLMAGKGLVLLGLASASVWRGTRDRRSSSRGAPGGAGETPPAEQPGCPGQGQQALG
ncbi:CMRF35-like molecule 8 isoform X2 [Struthio camelus]|uniref:CMRF35-like molecule 8 isoform X2 n=1 Tax=Struthio camelus TaxID=8801 RepID=UPI003603E487